MTERKPNKQKIEIIETVKEQAHDFVNDAKGALELAKEKINATLSEEKIEMVKQKSEVISDIAKEKATEFTEEAKDTIKEIKENASELASEAVEHIADFAEEAKVDIFEVKEKSKNFLQRLFGK